MNIPLSKIHTNSWNPNEKPEEQFEEQVKEIEHLGKPSKPLILRGKDEEYEIIDGEHTFRALIKLGIKELKEGWYEIVDYDNLESMRQTYKRNLGGKNNPVKLGSMFEKALKESGKSIRQLAEEWELSEGTIRNNLLYSNAKKMRNDYAFWSKLTNHQIRNYLKIAEFSIPIADLWLSCGAIDDALIWYSDEKFEKEKTTVTDIFDYIQKTVNNIIEQGFEKNLTYKNDVQPDNLSKDERKKYIQKFKNVIKKTHKLANLRKKIKRNFKWNKEIKEESINEYLDLYFNTPLFMGIREHYFNEFASMIIKKVEDKLEFILSTDEIKQCLKLEPNQGFTTFLNKVKLLIAKKNNIAPSEVKVQNGGLEFQMNLLELENSNAPEYIKQAKWPVHVTFKLAFIGIRFENDDIRKAAWDLVVKRYLQTKELDKIGFYDEEKYKYKMLEIIHKENEKTDDEKLMQKSELELAEIFIAKVNPISSTEKLEDDLVDKLSKNFPKSFLFLLVMLGNKYYERKQFNERMINLYRDVKKMTELTKSKIDKK